MTSERLVSDAPDATGRGVATQLAARPDGRVITPDAIGFRPHNCFACGQLNVSGLHLELHLEAGRCWAELELPRRFEGWEGIAHGGILCTILDEVMAWSLIEQDSWGVTAKLDVQFKRPVEIGQPIRADGWIVEGRRKVHRTAGRVVDRATGEELATAEGLYVAAPESKKAELKERYGYAALHPEDRREDPDGRDGEPA